MHSVGQIVRCSDLCRMSAKIPPIIWVKTWRQNKMFCWNGLTSSTPTKATSPPSNVRRVSGVWQHQTRQWVKWIGRPSLQPNFGSVSTPIYPFTLQSHTSICRGQSKSSSEMDWTSDPTQGEARFPLPNCRGHCQVWQAAFDDIWKATSLARHKNTPASCMYTDVRPNAFGRTIQLIWI